MALLGTQLVITLIIVSFIQKLGQFYSFSRWLLCSTGLVRYLYPTNDDLKSLAGIPKEKSKSKKDRGKHHVNGKQHTAETFHVPRNLDIQLESSKVSVLDVIHLPYYEDYQWLVDFSLYALVVYTLTEIYSSFFPLEGEVNLSILWCLLVIALTLKLIMALTIQYFKGSESVGERSTVIVTAFAYLIVAMAVLIVDESYLESGLEDAYASFNESALVFLQNHGLSSQGPASKLILKFFIALWCALIGALFTFPGLRMARMHWDCLKYISERPFLKLILNISFVSPFILVLMWIRPISRDYLTQRIFPGMVTPLMTSSAFESLRLILIVVTTLQRIVVMPFYLQTYLNMAYNRLVDQKKEAGRITNLELQKKVAVVFYYLCVVVLQYVGPILLCLFSALIYKTLGDYSWSGVFYDVPTQTIHNNPQSSLPLKEDILHSEQISLTLNSLKQVFTSDVYRGLFGFTTWWLCFAMFTSTSLGMVYQSYFNQA